MLTLLSIITMNFTDECRIEENYGFLKQNCQKINDLFQVKRCESHSIEQYYANFLHDNTKVLSLCNDDRHNYQSCGLIAASKIGTPITLCNQLLCFAPHTLWKASIKRLSYDACKINVPKHICLPVGLSNNRTLCQQLANEVVEIGVSEIKTRQCDMLCQDTIDCIDEANCNGFQYGRFCKRHGKMQYMKTSLVCNSHVECDDSSDERGCSSDGENLYSEKSCYTSLEGIIVHITNYTRCGPLWSREGKYESKCLDFKDQYNCSDPERGLLRCDKNTYPSTVSYGVLCKNSKALCDDEIDLKCQQTSENCLLHKHLLCNRRADCQDGSDENNIECQNLHSSICHRR